MLLLCLSTAPCKADEWGYEGQPDIPTYLPAAAPLLPAVDRGKTRAGAVKPAAVKAPSPQELKEQQSAQCWLKLYSLASPNELTEEQRSGLRHYLQVKLKSPDQAQFMAITDYWPAVEKAIDQGTDPRNSYRDLFRALLRLQERALRAAKSDSTADADVIAELLGPLRIAVPDTPPLTEDSINAYADMACFFYEQKNPGKTLDAIDNRTLFAKMICDRFRDAPTQKDKLAMINFDLSWAKLKILWAAADVAHRQKLLQQWSAGGATIGGVKPDATLDTILNHGPWTTTVKPSQDSGLQAQPQPGATKPDRISARSK